MAFPANVSPNELIESQWGNDVVSTFTLMKTVVPGGGTATTRLRAGSVVSTTDGTFGNILVNWTPALGDIYAITSAAVPGDQSPQIPVPIRGQFVRGATSTQWRFVSGDGTFILGAVVVLEYQMVELP